MLYHLTATTFSSFLVSLFIPLAELASNFALFRFNIIRCHSHVCITYHWLYWASGVSILIVFSTACFIHYVHVASRCFLLMCRLCFAPPCFAYLSREEVLLCCKNNPTHTHTPGRMLEVRCMFSSFKIEFNVQTQCGLWFVWTTWRTCNCRWQFLKDSFISLRKMCYKKSPTRYFRPWFNPFLQSLTFFPRIDPFYPPLTRVFNNNESGVYTRRCFAGVCV